MGFLDKLSSIFKIEVKSPKLTTIHFCSDNKLQKIEYYDQRKVIINIQKLDQKETAKLQKTISEAVTKEGSLLLEEGAKKILDDYSVASNQDKNKKILEFFKGKIPPTDLVILRASLYIRDVFNRGNSVENLKNGITQRYGVRGCNITNLCSAGYFESLIKPLYEEMFIQPTFSSEKFLSRYEVIVTQLPFAVFVNRNMSVTALEKEVRAKMVMNKKYGIKHLNIHGIGENNVEKIQDLLKKLKDQFTSIPEIDSERNFITVKISF